MLLLPLLTQSQRQQALAQSVFQLWFAAQILVQSSAHPHHLCDLPCLPVYAYALLSRCRYDELQAAWDLYTPVLHELERSQAAPELYPYGSRGPLGAHYLAARHNVRWGDLADDADDE